MLIISIITVIVSLSFLVFIHELGHYLAARIVGVHVIEFSIGFPPKVVSKIIGKTEYLISLIPIGGYVRLKGQGIEDEDPTDPENYAAKSILQRALILVSGPMMNLLVTLVLLTFISYFIGTDRYLSDLKKPFIGDVIANSEAANIDIRKNDLIISINDTSVANWQETKKVLKKINAPELRLKLQRDSEIIYRDLNSNPDKSVESFGLRIKTEPVIGTIAKSSPAETAGLLKGDRLLSINGKTIDNWSQITPLVQTSNGKELVLSLKRNESVMSISLTPDWNKDYKYWSIGIIPQTTTVPENLIDSVKLSFQKTYGMTIGTMEFLYKLIIREESMDNVGGPVKIAQIMGEAAQTSVKRLLLIVAFVSLQFSIFNILPIPALDGGHLLFLLIEKIKGGTLSKKFRATAQSAGFIMLIFLILYITVKDGINLYSG